jgi:hypothetical protein
LSQHTRAHYSEHAYKIDVPPALGLTQPYMPIQQRSWWLDVLRASPNYGEARFDENGKNLGLIPYFRRTNRLGFKWVRNPDWTSTVGPIFSEDAPCDRKAEILDRLIDQLPRNVSIFLCCKLDIAQNGELITAFKRRGFTHTQEQTFQVSPDEPDVLSRMKSKYRSQLKLAVRTLEVLEISPQQFIQFYEKNLRAKNMRSSRDIDLAQALIETSIARGNGRIVAARRMPGDEHAGTDFDSAIACIWDEERYYFWMSTVRGNPGTGQAPKPHKDALKALVLNAMQHAKSLNLVFDTDGSSTLGAAHLYKHILQIQGFEIRDIFLRMTPIVGLYEKIRPLLIRS